MYHHCNSGFCHSSPNCQSTAGQRSRTRPQNPEDFRVFWKLRTRWLQRMSCTIQQEVALVKGKLHLREWEELAGSQVQDGGFLLPRLQRRGWPHAAGCSRQSLCLRQGSHARLLTYTHTRSKQLWETCPQVWKLLLFYINIWYIVLFNELGKIYVSCLYDWLSIFLTETL